MAAKDSRPFTAASFSQFLEEKKLMASRCENCAALFLPPRSICPQCHHDRMSWEQMSGQGKLAAFTAVHIAPTFMTVEGYGRGKPYLSGVVELAEGVKISAQILGFDAAKPETIKISTPLQVEFVKRQDKTYLAFRPG
jgi:uncharacterized OB-fold protein